MAIIPNRDTMSYVGAYSAATTYETNDVALVGTTFYISLGDGNTGNTPATTPASWLPITGSLSYYMTSTANSTTAYPGAFGGATASAYATFTIYKMLADVTCVASPVTVNFRQHRRRHDQEDDERRPDRSGGR